jgi:hypothetical protein
MKSTDVAAMTARMNPWILLPALLTWFMAQAVTFVAVNPTNVLLKAPTRTLCRDATKSRNASHVCCSRRTGAYLM